MIISLKHGAARAEDTLSKEKTYELAGECMKKFEARNKSIICRELLGFDIGDSDNPHPDKAKIIMQQCPGYVKEAAEIIEELIY
jgi:hypothetical protein